MRRCLYLLVLMLPLVGRGQSSADSFHIYFDLDVPQLNAKAQARIDSLIYNDVISDNKSILIIGYADYLGSEKYNVKLSEKRAKNIQDYLVEMNIKPKEIKLVIGKGEIARDSKSSEGFAQDRKVDIVVLHNIKTASVATVQKGVTPDKPKTAIQQTIEKLQVGQTFILNNIYFYAGRHTVRKESIPELDNLVSVLKDFPTLKIKVEGHVCCVPSNKDALDEDVLETFRTEDNSPYDMNSLSVNRALYIHNYLKLKGISKDRLQYAGFGKTRPLVSPETTVEEENKNRRVEIRILAK